MAIAPEHPISKDVEAEKAELKALVESKLFSRAPSMVQFLTFVCSKYFEGNASQIKEYTIAVEAFGRSSDFQQKEDPIVRVEANRVRKRLKQYYETEGSNHQIQISIPPGQYCPSFEHRDESMQAFGPSNGSNDSGHLVPRELGTLMANREDGALEPYEPSDSSRSRSTVFRRPVRYAAAAILLTSLVVTATWWLAGNKPVEKQLEQLALEARTQGDSQKAISGTQDEVRILVGSTVSKYVDRLGRVWSGDQYFKGGSTFKSVVLPILRTSDPEIYQSGREGDFEYSIPLRPGSYELRLHFAELIYGPEEIEGGGETSRLIDVQANGRQLLQTFDISADAGGSRTADVKVFTDITPVDGMLKLSVVAYRGRGLLNAIEILPGVPGQMLPVRMTARQAPHFDKNRVMWEPERYFRGGRVNTRTNAIAETGEPELYQCERFGNFSYAIPVAQGSYRLTLKFAEAYFGETNAAKGGVGSRVFNVSCNGEPLLKNFDIYREAGGENRAVDKTFRGLQASAQGKLLLTFVPVQNYASVSAIEVVAESSSRARQ
jgi:malectin (di-glucose binding ER protein)